VVRVCAVAGLLLCAVVAVIYGAKHADWLAGTLAGIALAMGLMPEEFPVVLTISLALGAHKLSRDNVLTRRMPALETIGAVTVLGVDKTGTLTENRMDVVVLDTDSERTDLRKSAPLFDSTREVLATALAASELSAADRMEKAIHNAAQSRVPEAVAGLSQSALVREYDLTPELLAVTHVWQRLDRAELEVAVKGAPEAVFRLCRLSEEEQQTRLSRVATLASEGLRILAVARGAHVGTVFPDHPGGFDLHLLGLICFADPLRADVPAALAECHAAGIRVVMITGDHPGTASAIAREAGFASAERVVTGAELKSLGPDALQTCAREVSIYARMSPADKLTLVKAFKAQGEIVAMTGDGVNDAPALKAAHVGVAMGGRGSDVAREAASIVLLNDDFASLVRAVRSGRGIYDNLQHAMTFILAVHIPIAGMGLLPILLGWPVLLLPLHIVFLEFLIDPACAFVFAADPPAQDIMRRKARSPSARMFSAELLRRGVIMGSIVLGAVLAVYALALTYLDDSEARALGFAALVTGNIALILVNRGSGVSLGRLIARHNATFWTIGAASLVLLGCVIYIPAMATAFRFSEPSVAALIAVSLATIAAVLIGGLGLRRNVHRIA
jgi:Ca2+-transporting ATPase